VLSADFNPALYDYVIRSNLTMIPDSSQDDADLIYIGALCSEAVYEPQKQPTTEGFEFYRDPSLEIERSWNSNRKATAFFRVRRTGSDGEPITVISVKGTKGFLDKLICINSESSEATDFVVS
jgi:hypothetical protein